MGKIIAVSTIGGGVGKSVTVTSIAALLAQFGLKVLVIDADSRAKTSRSLGIDHLTVHPNIYHVYTQQIAPLDALHEHFRFQLIPGTATLQAIEDAMQDEGDEHTLKGIIDPLRDHFDFILIDSPASTGPVLLNNLVAADEVIIPLRGDDDGLFAVRDTITYINDTVWGFNPHLNIAGILPTMVLRTSTYALGIPHKARQTWGDRVFPVDIPYSIEVSKAFREKTPFPLYFPGHDAAKAYIKIARIIFDRYQHEKAQS